MFSALANASPLSPGPDRRSGAVRRRRLRPITYNYRWFPRGRNTMISPGPTTGRRAAVIVRVPRSETGARQFPSPVDRKSVVGIIVTETPVPLVVVIARVYTHSGLRKNGVRTRDLSDDEGPGRTPGRRRKNDGRWWKYVGGYASRLSSNGFASAVATGEF